MPAMARFMLRLPRSETVSSLVCAGWGAACDADNFSNLQISWKMILFLTGLEDDSIRSHDIFFFFFF
jgi:hypothetical protein